MMLMKSSSSLLDGISVIICCYNSEWIIARCLEALKKQLIPDHIKWEIVLVDNNCTDATISVAMGTMESSDLDFTIVRESTPGLMNARKKGIATIKYQYCIYCDDDNLLSPDYVSYMYNILATNPEVGAAGGKGIPEFESEPDPRILPYLTGYAVGSQTEHPEYLFGAGLTLRTEVVRTIFNNFQSTLVGRQESKLLSGDDLELVNYVKLMGYKLYPTDAIQYVHVLKANRLTEEYRIKMYEGLMLALPIGDMMSLAYNNGSMLNYFMNYLKSELALLKYSLSFWQKKDITQLKSFVRRIRFWGIFKMISVYKNCVNIKKEYQCH